MVKVWPTTPLSPLGIIHPLRTIPSLDNKANIVSQVTSSKVEVILPQVTVKVCYSVRYWTNRSSKLPVVPRQRNHPHTDYGILNPGLVQLNGYTHELLHLLAPCVKELIGLCLALEPQVCLFDPHPQKDQGVIRTPSLFMWSSDKFR